MKNEKKLFGTREWSKSSLNITIGCSNNCKYCYAKDGYNKTDESQI